MLTTSSRHRSCRVATHALLASAWMASTLMLSARTAAAVPFTYSHHEILVPVYIGGGGPFTFMVDSDTTPSAIALPLARRLRLALNGPAGLSSGIGSAKKRVVLVRIRNLTATGVTARTVDALAIDLSGLSASLGRRIDGVLGTSFLRSRVLQIDYPCREVEVLRHPVRAVATARFSTAASGDNVSHDVWIGAHRIAATFDTGDAGYSFVTATGIRDLALQHAAHAGRRSVAHGYNGRTNATTGTLDDVRIGRLRLGSLRTIFLREDNETIDVNIGNRALERFIVTLDYPSGTLLLSRPRGCAKPHEASNG